MCGVHSLQAYGNLPLNAHDVCSVYTCVMDIACYQVSLVVSGSSSPSNDRDSNPALTTGGHLRSQIRNINKLIVLLLL